MKGSAKVAVLVTLVLWACVTARVGADEFQISFPLGGYYRVGKYMPIHVQVPSGRQREFRISGEGLLPTIVTTRGGMTNVVAPVLVIGSTLRDIFIQDSPMQAALRELRADERLVAVVGNVDLDLTGLFPEQVLIPVQVDANLFRATPAVLWGMLDAAVIDDAMSQGLELEQWLAAGVELIVVGPAPPEPHRAWQRLDGAWRLHVNPLGPQSALVSESAYTATFSWHPWLSVATRRLIVLAGTLLTILSVSCALLRGWLASVALLILVVVSGICIATWQRTFNPLSRIDAHVAVEHPSLTQWDRWTYLAAASSKQPAAGRFPMESNVFPLLIGPAHVHSVNLQLRYYAVRGAGQFEFMLGPDVRLAFLRRWTTAGHPPFDPAPARSIFAPVVRSLYLRPGYELIGEIEQPDSLPTTVIRTK